MAEEGGGHGGNWIVTYADMITLLMAGFIVIVTFASRETDKLSPRNDSAIGTQGGTGVAGMLRKGPDKDQVVVRRAPMTGNAFDRGSEMPAAYSDSPIEVTKSVQSYLDQNPPGRLSDNFEIALPMGLMFEGNGNLSQAGMVRLQQVAQQIRMLPFEVLIQVGNSREIPQAIRVYEYLFQTCEVSPLRLGTGLKAERDGEGMLWLLLRHPPK